MGNNSEQKDSKESVENGSDKKMDTRVLVALIGVVTVIIGSIIAPIALRLVDRQLAASPTDILVPSSTPTLISPTDTLIPDLHSPTPTTAPVDTPMSTYTPTSPPPSETLSQTLPSPTPPIIQGPILFSPDCIHAGQDAWNFYPPLPNIQPVDDCWKIKEEGFLPAEDGLNIQKSTNPGSGEQQRGLYYRMDDDTAIQFDLKIITFRCETITADFRKSLAFAVTDTGSRFTYNGDYLYYNAGNMTDIWSKYQVIFENSGVAHTEYLDHGTTQKVRFEIEGSTLRIYVDDMEQPVATDTLSFVDRAFYIGYRLKDRCELNASLSNFAVTSP